MPPRGMVRWSKHLPSKARLGAWVSGACLKLLRVFRASVMLLGCLMLVALVLAFTTLPFKAHRWLGTAGGELRSVPDRILVLGGSGMPSGGELMRIHVAATLAEAYPDVPVLVVHARDTVVLAAMRAELVLRGVAVDRITMMMGGGNTREQALALATSFEQERSLRWAVVTAPEHMYRALGALRRVGFSRVGGVAAFETPLFVDLGYDHRRIGGRGLAPDVSGSLSLRYDLWHHLRLEVTCLREYLAIAHYKLNGWM